MATWKCTTCGFTKEGRCQTAEMPPVPGEGELREAGMKKQEGRPRRSPLWCRRIRNFRRGSAEDTDSVSDYCWCEGGGGFICQFV